MKIAWNKVTWYSKFIALALFVALPFLGFWLGMKYGETIAPLGLGSSVPAVIANPPAPGSDPYYANVSGMAN